MLNEMTPYQRRVAVQGAEWIGGSSVHNREDDECCPDFSCCMPELFERDRAVRIQTVNKWRAQYGFSPLTDDMTFIGEATARVRIV